MSSGYFSRSVENPIFPERLHLHILIRTWSLSSVRADSIDYEQEYEEIEDYLCKSVSIRG